jgi:hypothetical protein
MDKTDNEVLAEFMGLPLTKEEPMFTGGFKTVPFMRWKYNSDWNELMDVWHKFRDLKFDDRDNEMIIHRARIQTYLLSAGITEVFKALVEAVKWYNQTVKK